MILGFVGNFWLNYLSCREKLYISMTTADPDSHLRRCSPDFDIFDSSTRLLPIFSLTQSFCALTGGKLVSALWSRLQNRSWLTVLTERKRLWISGKEVQ